MAFRDRGEQLGFTDGKHLQGFADCDELTLYCRANQARGKGSRCIDLLLARIDRLLDDGVTHCVCNHQIDPRGQALPQVVQQGEVGPIEVGGIQWQELHEQVDVALARAVVRPQHGAKGVQARHMVLPTGGSDGLQLGLGEGEGHVMAPRRSARQRSFILVRQMHDTKQ